ncbi:hypothetical protein AUK11_02165 [bacterium CG2_30_37_16]|nr:MAG: hypothetical protein AUK11_02165 [bacterium CG2_30_37_16]PIP30791.1 MAG: hydrogenase [bacterium (Candidatus Howlettbacteria) CG23_combo_of_CG06-09_8_20_14_all_37_9]PIX98715.1 MAG: hydrogenase [bacterium (Candidatus Howlettbacteria) CG_4_10_14_3_um_filter_37_10]PJB06802.1 MAG: hydrogenase [bacterium (Candidatus Howlettbacteria) CG_4_9_14_3_um_filter_37_10]
MILAIIILTPLIAATLSLLVKKRVQLLELFTLLSVATCFISSIFVVNKVISNETYSLVPYFSVNALGIILLLLISFIGLIASIYSIGYIREETKKQIIGFTRVKQYYILLNLFLMAMFFAVATTSPITTWIAIEATTLSTAFLISFYNKSSSVEAAWKYLIINSVGLLLAFFGTLLFMSSSMSISASHNLISWNDLLTNAALFNPEVAKIAFVFILIGYGTKMGLVPMHTWLPDTHSKAPVPISSLLSGVLLNISFFAILRFKIVTDTVVGASFSEGLLMYFGLISILLSSFIIYLQQNYKRLLAYSTIEHMGIIALGVGFGGAALFAALLHMIYHSLAKPLLFLSSGNIFLKYSSTKIEKIRGAFLAVPITSAIFIIGFLAITGIPPFGMFLTEFSILAVGITNHPAIAVIVLFAFVLVFVGFLKHITTMVFGDKPEEIPVGEISVWNTLPLIVLVIVLILLGFYLPEPLKILLNKATLVY